MQVKKRDGRLEPVDVNKIVNAIARAAEWGVPDFLPEDKAICERGQRAATGDYKPGVIVAMEQVIVDFHHYLNRQLHGATTPAARTSHEAGIAQAADEDAEVR